MITKSINREAPILGLVSGLLVLGAIVATPASPARADEPPPNGGLRGLPGEETCVDTDAPVGAKLDFTVTGVQASGLGYVGFGVRGGDHSVTSSVNIASGVNIANSTSAFVGVGGELCFTPSVATHLTIDGISYDASGRETSDRQRYLDTRSRLVTVRMGQWMLHALGFRAFVPNGILDATTTGQIEDFQRSQNLAVTGDFDEDTARALRQLLSDDSFGFGCEGGLLRPSFVGVQVAPGCISFNPLSETFVEGVQWTHWDPVFAEGSGTYVARCRSYFFCGDEEFSRFPAVIIYDRSEGFRCGDFPISFEYTRVRVFDATTRQEVENVERDLFC